MSFSKLINFEPNPKRNVHYVVMDIEATGLDTDQDHILDICMKYIQVNLLYPVGRIIECPRPSLNTLVYTDRPSNSEALKVHHLDAEKIKNAPTMTEVADRIIDYLDCGGEPVILIAQNGFNFDFRMLLKCFERVNKVLPSTVGFADSYVIIKDKYGIQYGQGKLTRLYQYYCPQHAKDPHHSLLLRAHRSEPDVDMIIEIMSSIPDEVDDFLRRARAHANLHQERSFQNPVRSRKNSNCVVYCQKT
jgi:DNA polymerase III epsilon subunit-like protein